MIALPLIVAAALAVICVAIIYADLRFMRIPNAITYAVVILFVAWAGLAYPDVAIMSRLITAGVIFLICFGLFAARIMGGGDTKVIPALSLFIPIGQLSFMLLVFAACLLASIGLVIAARRTLSPRDGGWAVLSSKKLPMGVAIGTTGLIGLVAGAV